MKFYCQQIHGSSGADATTSMKNIVCLHNSQSFCHQLLKKGEDGAQLEKDEQTNGVTHKGTAQVSEWLNISDTAKKLY